MTDLVIAPLLVALATAVLSLFVRPFERLRAGVSLAGVAAYAVVVAALASEVLAGGTMTYQVGDWPAPFGITLVADGLSAFMLALTALVAVPTAIAGLRQVSERAQRVAYHPLFFFMLVGVSGAFLTGDVFNLFVWFEVLLMSSYVLVVIYGDPETTGATLRYVALNLVGSALMLVSIGGLYAVLGTLNMADMSRRLAGNAGVEPAAVVPALGLSAILFAVFALKAGVVPFHFWVPEVYRAAPTPVTAMLAGVVKKVGVYAMIRLVFTVFGGAAIDVSLPGVTGDALGFYGPVLFALAVASVALGGVGAVGRDDLPGLLAYSSISQVGFILLPVAIAATAGESVQVLALTAALVYALNHAVAKSMLFLVVGVIEDAVETVDMRSLGGIAGNAPGLGAAFFVGSLALVGIPPLSGFFGKLLIFDAAVQADALLALAAALGGAIFTIAYTSRAWNRAFWGDAPLSVEGMAPDRVVVGIVLLMAGALVVIGVGFDPVYRFAEAGAHAALDRQGYVDAVRFANATATGGGH